jgi:sec-independent protein translocase protein TatA
MGIGLLSPWHLAIILLIVVVVFGAGKLGQVGGALGKSVREFKTNVADPEEDARKAQEEAREAAEQARLSAIAAEAAKAKSAALPEPVGVASAATVTTAAAPSLRREEI